MRSGFPRYESLQPQYNLYDRAGYEEALEPLCIKHGLGVIPYYGLASGFLTGKYRSAEDAEGSARGGHREKISGRTRAADSESARPSLAGRGFDARVVALAWLIARPGITAPIASATSAEQLQDLFKAAELKLESASDDN